MDKKEAKKQYMLMTLADPNIGAFEKEQLRRRLGFFEPVVAKGFFDKHGDELLHFVSDYLHSQLIALRQRKRTAITVDFLSEDIQAIYHLCLYDSYFEDDTLEQLYDTNSQDDYINLASAFERIGRIEESAMIKDFLKRKTVTQEKILQLQEHFCESESVVQKINMAIEEFIFARVEQLIDLQTL